MMFQKSLISKWIAFVVLAGLAILILCHTPLKARIQAAGSKAFMPFESNGSVNEQPAIRRLRARGEAVDIKSDGVPTTPEGVKGDVTAAGGKWNETDPQEDNVVIAGGEGAVRQMVLEAVDSIMEDHLSPEKKHNGKEIYPGALPDIAEEVAICMVIRNQHSDLIEFLTHHYHHLGIRRFYIIDDGSIPALSNHQDYAIPRSAITFIYFTPSERPRTVKMQYKAYNTCNERFGKLHKWMGFLDADELVEITSKPGMSMAEFLQGYEKYGALGISWLTHNSNNRLKKSPEGNRKGYTSCIWDGKDSDNRHVKSFVQMKYYVEPTSPHSFRLSDGMKSVGEDEDVFGYAFRKITREKIGLHHYGVKSWEDYQEKMARGTAMGNKKDDAWWKHIESLPTQNCSSLAQYYP